MIYSTSIPVLPSTGGVAFPAFLPLPSTMANPPIISAAVASDGPSMAGGVQVDGILGGTAINPRFGFRDGVAANRGGYHVWSAPYNDAGLVYAVEFVTDSPVVDIVYVSFTGRETRIMIDGQYAEERWQEGGNASGAYILRTITHPDARKRRHRIESGGMPFVRICVPAGYEVKIAPTAVAGTPKGRRLLVIGDSYFGGTIYNSGYKTPGLRMGKMLGAGDTYNYSYGGTGIVAGGNDKYINRAATWTGTKATDVIIHASINDVGADSMGNILRGLASLILEVGDRLPDTLRNIVVTGTPQIASLPQSYYDHDAALKDFCGSMGVPYIQVSQLYNAGNVGTYVAADGVHPTDAGSLMLATAYAQGIVAAGLRA